MERAGAACYLRPRGHRDPARFRRRAPATLADEQRRAELRAATKRLHAIGIEGEVVVTGTADDLIAYLDANEPKCAPLP